MGTTDEPSTVATTETPTCGDGLIDDGEECDEGEKNSQFPYSLDKACLRDCSGYTEYCGDGEFNEAEVCDEGGENSDAYSEKKHCNQDCSGYAPHCGDGDCQVTEDKNSCPGDCELCGDGKFQAGEQCDGMGNTADCDEDCTRPVCGDGLVNLNFMNEQCEDQNMDNTDDCVVGCQSAACGDGFLHAGVEECDDKNEVDIDACSNDCVPARRVFVTADAFSPVKILGVAGADGLCQAAAMNVPGLGTSGNTWLAWLSDDTSSPSTRFSSANKEFAGYYLLPTGTAVAKGWAGLTSGELLNPINITEMGLMAIDPKSAWTNTKKDGTTGGTNDCEDWSVTDEEKTGGRGRITMKSEQWTVDTLAACSNALRLYCIEVSP